LVFGAGAIGSVLATLLSERHEVDVAVRGDRIERVAREGISITGTMERTIRPDPHPEGTYDVIFITTKAYETATAAEAVGPFTHEDSVVASLQNGMSNLEILEKHFGDHALAGLTTMGATKVDPVTVNLVDRGRTVVGPPSGCPDRARIVASMLNDVGMDCTVSSDIHAEVWMKAVINTSINPVATLAGRSNGAILEHPPLYRLSERACAEAVRAAEANGVALPVANAFSLVKEVIWSTRNNRCSTLQDLATNRRSEIDEITGALVQKGEAAGAVMAVNRSLWALIREMEGRPMDY